VPWRCRMSAALFLAAVLLLAICVSGMGWIFD
jgi:hypothetical protein